MALFHIFLKLVSIVDNTGTDHLPEQVISFTGTLAHTGKYSKTVMTFGDIMNHLHDKHRLSHTGTAEKTDLSSFGIRFEQIDDFYTGIKHLGIDGKIFKTRSRSMNRSDLFVVESGKMDDGIPHHIHQPAFDLIAGRHSQRTLQIDHFHSSGKTVGCIHGNAADSLLTDVLFYLYDKVRAIGALYFQRIVNRR